MEKSEKLFRKRTDGSVSALEFDGVDGVYTLSKTLKGAELQPLRGLQRLLL